MSSCGAVPTTTQFSTQVFTSTSLSTSFSTSVSTSPPTTVTSVSIVCLDTNTSNSNAVCSSTSSSLVVVTSPGSTSTVSVPITITVPVTLTSLTPTKTLFSTSCAPTTISSTTPSSIDSLTSSFTSSLSEVTPPPLTFTSASSLTLSDGAVVTTDLVLTSSIPPTSVYVTTARPVFNSDHSTNSSSKVGPIVGGVVGGIIGALGLVFVFWLLWRRTKRWKDIFDREEDEKEQRRMTLGDEDVQPRPYHYGLVGHSISPTPPSTPPMRAQEHSPSHSPSNSLSLLNPSRLHSRSSSAADAEAVSSGSDLTTPTGHTGHTRANLSTASSTAASTVPLLARPVNLARPTTSRSMDGQSSRAGLNLFGGTRSQPVALASRPHSANASLPSGAAPAMIPGAISRDASVPTQTSPVTEKRRIQQNLLQGAAAPVLPTPAVPSIPGPGAGISHTVPPLTQRSPRRPSSSPKTAEVPVGGLVPDSQPLSRESQPPAYSPT